MSSPLICPLPLYVLFPQIPLSTLVWSLLSLYITLTSLQMPLTPKVTSGASTIICYTKCRLLAGPTHRLAIQQVGYDQKGKSAVVAQIAAKLTISSQYPSLVCPLSSYVLSPQRLLHPCGFFGSRHHFLLCIKFNLSSKKVKSKVKSII